eukprot:g5737.t1
MVIMKASNRWLGFLGAAVIASAASVSAYHGASYDSSECYDDWSGDGYCDSRNNNELCGYDGGDCCSCTCESDVGNDYRCRSEDFACVDPAAPCVDDDDITIEVAENCGYIDGIGNGWCDLSNNNAGCGYDGGDCCICTCNAPQDDDDYACSDDANSYACIDPAAPCVDDDDITAEVVENCFPRSIGNGYCNHYNNKPECDYDGGDCCECTCVVDEDDEDDGWKCSHNAGFACIDPAAPCVDDDEITVEMVEHCHNAGNIGNGYCDEGNNTAECNYDGGDCCECTCESPVDADDDYICTEFACVDPEASCVDDDSITIDMLDACDWVTGIGNGWCNIGNNIPECNYDGGDCCECTCQVQFSNGCQQFACVDPDAECVDDDDITVDMFENCDSVLSIGDGYCNSGNNNAECGWDGGDCCYCTCEKPYASDWLCSANGSGFNCKDESAPCFGEEPPTSYDDDYSTNDDVMSYNFIPWEQDGPLPTVEGAVEVGDKTEVGVTATGYDERPGWSAGMNGCGEDGGDGCEAANSRDGIASEFESRWSCVPSLVEGGGPCQIEYTFAEPQDVVDIQIAFWKANERTRTLDVYINGEMAMTHESYAGPTFNELGVVADDVTTIMLESSGPTSSEWISLIEVLIFVKPDQEPLPIVEGAVEVGDKTEVGVTATGYDERPGRTTGMNGCGEEGGSGCEGPLTRDGVTNDIESRWSCAPKLVEGGGPCQVEYTFAEPQDIVDIQVAFRKADERTRTLDVYINGEMALAHESYAGPTFNTLGVVANGVTTVMLEAAGLMPDQWISLIEVLIFVKPDQEPLPTVDGAIEVSTKTQVGVSATAHDERPGRSSGMNGCGGEGGDGCAGPLTLDGVTNDIESRWSCSPGLVEGGGPCRIEYTFAAPQQVMDIQVAFRKVDERTRTLDVYINDEKTHTHESYSGSAFNTLGVTANEVTEVMLEATGLTTDEWISLIEVLIFVQP